MTHILRVKNLAYGGEGTSDINGKICFIEGALPDETVKVEITETKKKFLRARVLEVLESSPHREIPLCPVVTKCGGCQYQHVKYSEELRWKSLQVQEYLKRNLSIPSSLCKEIVPSPKSLHYRNQLTLHYLPGSKGEGVFIGADNKTPVSLDECLLAHQDFKDIYQKKVETRAKKFSVTYRRSEKGDVQEDTSSHLFKIRIGGRSVWTHSKSFFQNNLEVTELIAAQIKTWLSEKKYEMFLDLYAGIGTFTLLSASEIETVVCAEENPYSLLALEKNFNDFAGTCHLIEGCVEKIMPGWFKEHPLQNPAVLFLDPPRAGLDEKFCRFLASKPLAETLIYLSCHLGALARDLKILTESGAYQITEVVPFDMFPRTKHIETLVLLKRN